jgi:hypothetical protein
LVGDCDSPSGIIAPITINGNRATMVVDSASDISCITPLGAQALGLKIINEKKKKK